MASLRCGFVDVPDGSLCADNAEPADVCAVDVVQGKRHNVTRRRTALRSGQYSGRDGGFSSAPMTSGQHKGRDGGSSSSKLRSGQHTGRHLGSSSASLTSGEHAGRDDGSSSAALLTSQTADTGSVLFNCVFRTTQACGADCRVRRYRWTTRVPSHRVSSASSADFTAELCRRFKSRLQRHLVMSRTDGADCGCLDVKSFSLSAALAGSLRADCNNNSASADGRTEQSAEFPAIGCYLTDSNIVPPPFPQVKTDQLACASPHQPDEGATVTTATGLQEEILVADDQERTAVIGCQDAVEAVTGKQESGSVNSEDLFGSISMSPESCAHGHGVDYNRENTDVAVVSRGFSQHDTVEEDTMSLIGAESKVLLSRRLCETITLDSSVSSCVSVGSVGGISCSHNMSVNDLAAHASADGRSGETMYAALSSAQLPAIGHSSSHRKRKGRPGSVSSASSCESAEHKRSSPTVGRTLSSLSAASSDRSPKPVVSFTKGDRGEVFNRATTALRRVGCGRRRDGHAVRRQQRPSLPGSCRSLSLRPFLLRSRKLARNDRRCSAPSAFDRCRQHAAPETADAGGDGDVAVSPVVLLHRLAERASPCAIPASSSSHSGPTICNTSAPSYVVRTERCLVANSKSVETRLMTSTGVARSRRGSARNYGTACNNRSARWRGVSAVWNTDAEQSPGAGGDPASIQAIVTMPVVPADSDGHPGSDMPSSSVPMKLSSPARVSASPRAVSCRTLVRSRTPPAAAQLLRSTSVATSNSSGRRRTTWVCAYCSLELPNNTRLIAAHQRSHKFKCVECQTLFNTQTDMYNHHTTEHRGTSFWCEVCSVFIYSQRRMNAHRLSDVHLTKVIRMRRLLNNARNVIAGHVDGSAHGSFSLAPIVRDVFGETLTLHGSAAVSESAVASSTIVSMPDMSQLQASLEPACVLERIDSVVRSSSTTSITQPLASFRSPSALQPSCSAAALPSASSSAVTGRQQVGQPSQTSSSLTGGSSSNPPHLVAQLSAEPLARPHAYIYPYPFPHPPHCPPYYRYPYGGMHYPYSQSSGGPVGSQPTVLPTWPYWGQQQLVGADSSVAWYQSPSPAGGVAPTPWPLDQPPAPPVFAAEHDEAARGQEASPKDQPTPTVEFDAAVTPGSSEAVTSTQPAADNTEQLSSFFMDFLNSDHDM